MTSRPVATKRHDGPGVCRSPLLSEGEPEISDALADYLRDEGIKVRTGVTCRRI